MALFQTFRFIANHPLNKDQRWFAIYRFLKWQFRSILNPKPYLYSFTEKVKLVVERGMTGATGNIYTGLHEFHDMAFLLHFLRQEDTFVDIGANIGSFTMLASAHVGAKSISFEPVPRTYSNLIRNINANHIHDKVIAFNIAIGSKKGVIEFTSTLDTMNHVSTKNDKDIIKVNVETLDNVFDNLQAPSLLKIDVEGYETEVIQGAENTLRNHALKALIIELPGAGERYGYDESKLHDYLVGLGFLPYNYDPWKRNLFPLDSNEGYSTLYVRDVNFVLERLQSAPFLNIHRKEL